jgi:Uma2 family endonuclease
MATAVSQGGEQRLLLYGIDWRGYRRLRWIFKDRPGVRITYDRGALEIMTTSPLHEHYKWLLGRFIATLTEELNVPVAGYGSMTFLRPRSRALEPDQCFWMAQEARMRARDQIDFKVDPPPDLVVEVDITSSSLDRMAIYAVLGVLEVWRFNDEGLTFQALQANRTYAAIANSLAFPAVACADVAGFLALRTQLDETTLMRQFRAWVRQHVAGTGGSAVP